MWPEIKTKLTTELAKVIVGQPDGKPLRMSLMQQTSRLSCLQLSIRIHSTISRVTLNGLKNLKTVKLLLAENVLFFGCKFTVVGDDSQGYFVEPTVILCKDPKAK